MEDGFFSEEIDIGGVFFSAGKRGVKMGRFKIRTIKYVCENISLGPSNLVGLILRNSAAIMSAFAG